MCLLMYLELKLMSFQTVVAEACCFLEEVVKCFCCSADVFRKCDTVRGTDNNIAQSSMVIYPAKLKEHTASICRRRESLSDEST